jgi:hypothetical protein
MFMGNRVSAAFGLSTRGRASLYPYCKWIAFDGRLVSVVPHPSAINRWWNSKANASLARQFIQEAVAW